MALGVAVMMMIQLSDVLFPGSALDWMMGRVLAQGQGEGRGSGLAGVMGQEREQALVRG